MTSYKYISPINNSSTLTDNEAAILIAECFTCSRKTLTKIEAEIFLLYQFHISIYVTL